MKAKLFSLIVFSSLLLAACSSAGPKSVEAAAIPTAIADTSIMAEGRLEPVHFAEITFSTSGAISEVLVKEGDQVTEGQPLIRLGSASNTNYASAQLELVSAKQAINDLNHAAGTDLAQAIIELKDAQEAYAKADDYLI